MSTDYGIRTNLARRGRLWKVCRGNAGVPGAGLTGQTAYDDQQPLFIISQTSGANKVRIEDLVLSQVGTVAGGVVTYVVVIDTADRYTSGGDTTMDAEGPYAGTDKTPAVDHIVDNSSAITVVAEGAGTRVVGIKSAPATLGHETKFEGPFEIGATGSILVYGFAGTTGPTVHPDFRLIEESIDS